MWSKEKYRNYQREWRQRPESKLKLLEIQRRYRKKHREERNKRNKLDQLKIRLRRLGLNASEYDRMLMAQDNRCAICRTHADELNRRFAIDHCHKTGRVRGLLCHRCNTGLGMFKDVPLSILLSLSDYVQSGGFLTSEQKIKRLSGVRIQCGRDSAG